MFVQVLANLEGIDLTAYQNQAAANPTFSDTSPASWYFAAVEWATRPGLASGVGDGNFAPNRPITRQEMAVFLNNYIVSRGIALPQGAITLFTDHGDISSWAVEGVTAIQAAGIISGHPDGRFAPTDTATRAEVATIFARFLDALGNGANGNGTAATSSHDTAVYIDRRAIEELERALAGGNVEENNGADNDNTN